MLTDTIGVRLGVATTHGCSSSPPAVSVLFAPVTVVVQTVLYFDLRVRRDGWDLPAVTVGGDAGTPDDTATVAG